MTEIKKQNRILKISMFFFVVAFLIIPKNVGAFGAVVSDPQHTAVSKANGIILKAVAGSDKITASTTLKSFAKTVLLEASKAIANRALVEITKSTINWINSGFHGAPLFLENPNSFFKDIAKYEIRTFIDTIGYDRLRMPFGRSVALNALRSYNAQLNNNLEYSLSRVIPDENYLRRYREDFNVGGWEGFLINTQIPSNNYIGFQLEATEELARKLDGTVKSNAERVEETLAQGSGFLSPMKCPSNPSYNTAKNQFIRPSFKPTTPYVPPLRENYATENEWAIAALNYQGQWDAFVAEEKKEWAKENVCTGGLQATTPGAVVADAAMRALGAGPEQTGLKAAVGGSLSAIFDALLNKFLGDGLKSLSTKINPRNTADNWDYEGYSLGSYSPYDSTISDWASGPDNVIVLSEFKKKVAEGIKYTEEELKIITNDSITQPGIEQVYGAIWPKTRDLDRCIPGPDLGWEDRLDQEMERNASVLNGKTSDEDGNRAAAALRALRSLEFAVSFFEDWIKNKMMTELPSSVLFIDQVESIEDIHSEADYLEEQRRTKVQELARLESILNGLNNLKDQPEQGSDEEEVLIELAKQYRAIEGYLSTPGTIAEMKSKLLVEVEKYEKLEKAIEQCNAQRTEKNWSVHDWSTYSGAASVYTGTPTASTTPAPGGSRTPSSSTNTGSGTANPLEQGIFCGFPIYGGYTHDSFNGPDTTRPRLPMVNAKSVYNDSSFFGLFGDNVHININCGLFYTATDLVYKGNIRGLTGEINYIDPIIENTGEGNTPGGQCNDTGNDHASVLRNAIDAVINNNPSLANLPNEEINQNGRGVKINGKLFLTAVADHINNSGTGYRATAEILNGNNNTSTGDIIGIWKEGDSLMERYDAIEGDDTKTVGEAAQTNFDAFVPLNCTTSGGGNDCGCSSGGGNEEDNGQTLPLTNPPAIDTANWSNVDWMDTNPSSWSQTSQLSVSISGRTINVPHSKAGAWPIATPFGDSTTAEGNAWIFVYKNGRWKAATFDFLRPGQTQKDTSNITDACGALRGELSNFRPTAGQLYGFMVSGISRSGYTNNIQERSNVVMYSWNGATSKSAPNACGGGSTTPTPTTPTPTTPPLNDNPFVSTVSPNSVRAGSTTITISGTNLTSTVQFFDGSGKPYTIVGNVNSGKTQVTALVPAELPVGNATVKIYKNASTVSNGKLIKITSTGGSTGGGNESSGTITTVTPTNVFVPTGIDRVGYLDRMYPNGWWPSLSPNGRFVAFGNWGDSFVVDLESTATPKQMWNFNKPEGLPQDGKCLAGQWLSNTKLTFICESQSTGFYRYEVTVGEWVARKTNDSSASIGATMFRAEDNNWVSYLAPGQISKNGQILATGSGGAVSTSGNTFVHACTNQNQSICVRNGTTLSKTYSVKSPMHKTAVANNYIIYGGYGPTRGINPSGSDTDLTVAPWRWEDLGDVVMVNSTAWVATTSYDNRTGNSYIFLRPWGSKSVIAVEAPAVWVNVAVSGSNFKIAYNDDKGAMKVLTVPINSTRRTLQ